MSGIRAVIFDSDGTLIDSFGVIVAAYAHVAALHGYPAPSREEIQGQLALARPLHEIYHTFFPSEDVEQLIRENGEFLASNAAGIAGYEDLKPLLAALRSHDMLLAVVTGGNHKIHDVLRHHDIDTFFASIVHCDRVSRAKPDPEGVLIALDECGVFPNEAVMVGDSPNDIFAGKNAAVRYTIGITHGHGGRADLAAADPDYLVDSLAELQQLLITLCTKQ